MSTPYAFTAIGKVALKDRGIMYTGYCPWDLTDRKKIEPMIGQRVTVFYDGGVVVGTIKELETASTIPGPAVGQSVGLLIE